MSTQPLNEPAGDDLEALRQALRHFAAEREWGVFHSPKNLAMALTVEAAELQEHFQWLTEAQSRELPADRKAAVALEVADVLLYLVQLADQLGIDLMAAAQRKLALNEARYPAEKARGTAAKYDEL